MADDGLQFCSLLNVAEVCHFNQESESKKENVNHINYYSSHENKKNNESTVMRKVRWPFLYKSKHSVIRLRERSVPATC